MNKFLVLFDRDRNDEVFDSVPGDTSDKRYHQLVNEIYQAESLPMRLVTSYDCEGLRDIFIVEISFDGDSKALVNHLQYIYDEVGVAGWFHIIKD